MCSRAGGCGRYIWVCGCYTLFVSGVGLGVKGGAVRVLTEPSSRPTTDLPTNPHTARPHALQDELFRRSKRTGSKFSSAAKKELADFNSRFHQVGRRRQGLGQGLAVFILPM